MKTTVKCETHHNSDGMMIQEFPGVILAINTKDSTGTIKFQNTVERYVKITMQGWRLLVRRAEMISVAIDAGTLEISGLI